MICVGMFSILLRVASYVIPPCLGAYENVSLDLDTRVTVNASQRKAVNLSGMQSTKSRAAY